MPACATQETVGGNVCVGNVILPVPDTDFREFLDEVEELARFAPEIIEASPQPQKRTFFGCVSWGGG